MNKDIQAVFFDLDGTIYDLKSHSILPSTFLALEQLKMNGYKIAISSARPKETIGQIKDIFTIPWDGIVSAGGQEIWNEKQELLFDNGLSIEELTQIFQIAKDNHIPIYAGGDGCVFYTEMNEDTKHHKEHFHIPVDQIKDYEGEKIQLITLLGYDTKKYESLFQSVSNIQFVYPGAWYTDVFKAHVSKATGIHQLMKYWGFNETNYMAFGDSMSDLSMLMDANIGVAMGNSDDTIKKQISIHCLESYNDGIYQFLKEHKFI